jgi:hypothetical protein
LNNELESSDPFYWTLDEIVQWIDPLDETPPTGRLLKALQSGHVSATGRRVIISDAILGYRPPELGQREEIRAFLWADLKISPYDLGDDLLCVLEKRGDHWRPAWRDVLVERQRVLAFWVPRGSPNVEQSATSIRTGLPGKPSSKHLYLDKLSMRIEAGEIAPTLKEEAEFLMKWLRVQYPHAPSSGISAIQNVIRAPYKEGRRQTPHMKILG